MYLHTGKKIYHAKFIVSSSSSQTYFQNYLHVNYALVSKEELKKCLYFFCTFSHIYVVNSKKYCDV